ncbi:MAG: hypothetical protein KAH20_00595 [Methylococcales bacterium]|nr:hypothetical protein [Methylococcales bacterium]
MNRFLMSTISFFLFSTISFAAPPEAPTLVAKVNGFNVSLSWTEVEGAAGYALYYTPAPFLNGDIERFDKGSKLAHKLSLFLGDSYLVAVKSYNANNEESEDSNIELVTINHVNILYVGLSRYQYNNIKLKGGTFQVAADIDDKFKLSSARLITPDNTIFTNINVKKSNQIELFIDSDLASMEPYLLEGTYHLEGNYIHKSNPNKQRIGKVTFKVNKGGYPPFPRIITPAINSINVSRNPRISFFSKKPSHISITKLKNLKEAFFSNDIKYKIEKNGAKTILIESVTLEPKTKYLLEINETDKSVAKGSTSEIVFTTK